MHEAARMKEPSFARLDSRGRLSQRSNFEVLCHVEFP